MFRRVAASSAARPLTAARKYTDYKNFEFIHLKSVTVGVPVVLAAFWIAFFAWGSVWWESNRIWKRAVNASWARRLPKGYVWADELPAEPIKNIYKNLPSSAE